MSVLGVKNDKGKLRWSLLPLDAMREVVRVLMGGANKYAPNNWIHVEDARDRYFDAAIRHLTDWHDGERNDKEWGLHHLAHASCCTIFLLALSLRGLIDSDEATDEQIDAREAYLDEPIPYLPSDWTER